MIRVSRLWSLSSRRDCLPRRSRLSVAASGHDAQPHDRAATARAATVRASESSDQGIPTPLPVRLLDTQARGHIGRRVLHQQPDGELTEDSVWRWSSAPDRYLDTALHFEVASSRDMRLVDTGSAPALGATLLVWDLESGGTRLVGAVEFQITGTDRVVDTKWCGPASPSHRSYLATWLPPRADSCGIWRLRVSARRKRTIRKRGIVADEVVCFAGV